MVILPNCTDVAVSILLMKDKIDEVLVYLTIIPRARMGSESIAHEAKGQVGY